MLARHRAEPLLREALAVRRARLGDKHRATTLTLRELGLLLLALERYAEAEIYLREVLEFRRATQPPGSTGLLDIRSLLRQALIGLGRHEEAEALMRTHAAARSTPEAGNRASAP